MPVRKGRRFQPLSIPLTYFAAFFLRGVLATLLLASGVLLSGFLAKHTALAEARLAPQPDVTKSLADALHSASRQFARGELLTAQTTYRSILQKDIHQPLPATTKAAILNDLSSIALIAANMKSALKLYRQAREYGEPGQLRNAELQASIAINRLNALIQSAVQTGSVPESEQVR